MNWEKYLEDLIKNNDEETADFLSAIRSISEVEAKNLEDSNRRSEINSMTAKISTYIAKYKDTLYEISMMDGFFYPLDQTENIDRDYYYYIADQKMKAAVYYARFCNILETNQNKDIAYIKYLMLNNMMREVRFFGASYQYLWHWEKRKAHLFRNVNDNNNRNPSSNGLKADGVKSYFEEMFNKVIAQMNQSREDTFSYSTDPFIDIFKYLKIEAGNSQFTLEKNGIMLSINGIENNSTAKFEIITDAEINSVFCGSEAHGYYEFIQIEYFNPNCEYPFAVELYPILPEEEKNSKDTTKNIKDFIFNYLNSWNKDSVKHIGSWVADDKEVVTCGKIVANTVDVKDNNIPKTTDENTSYYMELTKEDVIYLILKLMDADESITDSFIFELVSREHLRYWVKQVKEAVKKGDNPPEFRGKTTADSIKAKGTSFKIDITSLSPDQINNNSGTVDECVNSVSNKIFNMIKEYFKDRFKSILASPHKVSDFILDFIKSNGYTCPEYISSYNEFSREQNDAELVLLKTMLFKQERC